jgi:hypothetical protein
VREEPDVDQQEHICKVAEIVHCKQIQWIMPRGYPLLLGIEEESGSGYLFLAYQLNMENIQGSKACDSRNCIP